MTKILFAAAESAPFFKTGGLGDVTYSLPKALVKAGADIRVVVPYYARKMPEKYRTRLLDETHFYVQVGWRRQYCGVKTLQLGQITYYFIDNQFYFNRDAIYGYGDDGERFAFFQLAVLTMMEKIKFIPDVLHVNDWHTALIPLLLKEKFQWIKSYHKIKTILTIHNLRFQGIFNPSVLSDLFGISLETFNEEGVKFYDAINFMKAGINFADLVTTVSPSYAEEIKTPVFGDNLDGVLRANNWKLTGIINGIDTDLYDPLHDSKIPHHFSAVDMSGKNHDKVALQEKVHLPKRNVPIFSMITRLTRQKGADLFLATLDDFLVRHDAQVIVLGTGDQDLEEGFKYFHDRYPGQFAAKIKFDETLAQRIYAGSDFFVMPSAFEPCGLSQMMAMRYGALPVVHQVGGLKDTVIPYNSHTGEGTGFGFINYSSVVLGETLQDAFLTYVDHRPVYDKLVQQAMKQDFGWAKSADKYLMLYQKLSCE